MTERETLKTIREGILSGKCSDGNLAWIVNLCDEVLAESVDANDGNAAAIHKVLEEISSVSLGNLKEPIDGDSSNLYQDARYEGDRFVGVALPAWIAVDWYKKLKAVKENAEAALSEPARNCDVMSRSACTKHFSTIYEGNRDGLCDVQTEREKNIHLYYIKFNKWLFAQAEERKGECDGR